MSTGPHNVDRLRPSSVVRPYILYCHQMEMRVPPSLGSCRLRVMHLLLFDDAMICLTLRTVTHVNLHSSSSTAIAAVAAVVPVMGT